MKTNNSNKDKVQQLQNKLYLTAKKCSSRRFHALYDKVYQEDVLFEAWKRVKAMEVRNLYAKGYAIDEIMRLTGHTVVTIKNYLKDDCPLSNGHYDRRMPGKLTPYEC